MLQSAAKDSKPNKVDSKFKKENPGYDRNKTYQIVGYDLPKKIPGGIRHKAIRWHSINSKRDGIRWLRKLLRWNPTRFSHVDMYGPDNTLLYQAHFNQQENRIISEEL